MSKFGYLLKIAAMLDILLPIRVVNNEKDRSIFIKVWHTIWLEENYAQPDESIIEKYSKYDSYSVDYLLKFIGIFPIGTLRIIKYNKDSGLPVLNDFLIKRKWSDDNNVVEATLLTVKKNFRKTFLHIPSLIIMREIVRYCRHNDHKDLVMACDERLFFNLSKKLNFPIYQIGPEKFYEGSDTYPTFMGYKKFRKTQKINNAFVLS